MATDVYSAPSCPGPDLDHLPLAERRRRLLRPPAPRVDEPSPYAPDRCDASAAAEGAGGAAQQSWPGLPRGTQFNPSDSDLLWHLAAEVGNGHACRHPFISEFIKSIDENIGFSCTHPQDIPGIMNDGRASYFFHRSFKVYNNESDKCISWQKSGTPRSIILDGNLRGCKEVFVLYAYETNESNPQRTDWRLHQYHIKNTMKDAGELVVSKIFHKSQKSCFQLAEKAHAQPAQDASGTDDDSKDELQLENHFSNRATESRFVQGNGNMLEQMEVETRVDENKLSSCNAVVDSPHVNNGDQIINNHAETDELDHISLQERYRILLADKHSCPAMISSEQCVIDDLENSCRKNLAETSGSIPESESEEINHEGTIFRDDICSMLQEITSAPPIIDSMGDDSDRRLLGEGPSDTQQTHETGRDSGFLSMPSPAAPSLCQVGCSHDPSVNVNALICSTEQTLSPTPTCGDENVQLEARNHGTFLVDVKLEPSLEGDLAGTSSKQSTDPKHVTEGCSLVGSVSSDICKRTSEAASCQKESTPAEGSLPSLGVKGELTVTELRSICEISPINITETAVKNTHTLNQDGGLAYCSRQRKRRKIARDPDEKVLEEDSYINEDGIAYCSRRRRRRKTATDSIETALEEDAPGLLQILLDRGIMVKEIKLYGVEEDDETIPDCAESDFQDLENVITKLFTQRASLLKSVARHAKGEKAIYCLACLISLVEQSRYLQFRDCPVEWGWCRYLQSFIFVFKSHNRIVLERPEYGYATYFFEIVQSLPIEWQIRRLVTAMKLSNCGRTALIENRPLLVGEDLTEGEALVLEEYGWIPNTGLGTMLNYCDRVVHDRWNEKSSTDWRMKIGKLLMHGYSEGQLVTAHIPKKVGKLLEDIQDAEIKLEDPY